LISVKTVRSHSSAMGTAAGSSLPTKPEEGRGHAH
jgi:hypothetical protein